MTERPRVPTTGIARLSRARADTGPAYRAFSRAELITIHVTVYRWRRLAEASGLANPLAFRDYDAFGVLPTHVHLNRGSHAHAIRLMSDGLRNALPGVDTYAETHRL